MLETARELPQWVTQLTYLVASVLFIVGLKGLSHPRSAVRGNFIGALGMFLAVVVTLLDRGIISYEVIFAGIVVGSALGAILAVKVPMTSIPQLVALFNGFGGIASVLVAGGSLLEATGKGVPEIDFTVASAATGLIGAVTFWGSLIAFAKLQELISDKFLTFPGQQYLNGVVLIAALVAGGLLISDPTNELYFWILVGISSLLGVFLVTPIGGADMPVVIALLNSYSGMAAAATGFVLGNSVLIISGSLVGASGIILTQIMCKAMNRSLTNVLFGVMAAGGETASADEVYGGKVKSASAVEIAMFLETAERVVIVPGYGMAVAQAQHAVRDLCDEIESKGASVEFAIHPVAGRMPGHMNVLLAEAEIPYEQLKEMDAINPSFEQTDVVIVIGANDVVNPLARTDPNSPIAGMPILNVDKARTVVVIKRSLSPGFAGIPNPLFAADNCLMLFGDGKAVVLELIAAVQES